MIVVAACAVSDLNIREEQMGIVNLNEIGTINHFEFAENVYEGCETLGVSMDCFAEIDNAESHSAVGSNVFIEIDDEAYFGEVLSAAFVEKYDELSVLIKLISLDE